MDAESRLVVDMSVPDPSLPVDVAGTTFVPGEDLRRLGEALKARTDDVVAGMVVRTQQSGQVLDAVVEERFERVGTVSTVAVARWMAGEGPRPLARSAGSPGVSSDSWRRSARRR